MEEQLGIQVDGAFFNEDGTTLGWSEFIQKIESVGLCYGGTTLWINSNGDTRPGIETTFPKYDK